MVVELTCPARMWTKSRTQLWRVVLAPHSTYRHGGAEFLQLTASRRAGADRIGSTIDTLFNAGAEY
jgi:hypothetical protein